MRAVLCAGSVLLVLLSACGSPPVETVAVDAPVWAPTHDVVIAWQPLTAAPERLEVPALAPIRRPDRARLEAPIGLFAARYDLPFLITEPVVWDDSGPTEVAVAPGAPDLIAGQSNLSHAAASTPERIDLEAAAGRLDTTARTLAALALQQAELSRTLDALRAVIPTLPRARRLRAGLRACALRRELDDLADAQYELQRDVVAARDELDPTVRLATR